VRRHGLGLADLACRHVRECREEAEEGRQMIPSFGMWSGEQDATIWRLAAFVFLSFEGISVGRHQTPQIDYKGVCCVTRVWLV
jgi:hypothetical protein